VTQSVKRCEKYSLDDDDECGGGGGGGGGCCGWRW
jgi:hypothetical protein